MYTTTTRRASCDPGSRLAPDPEEVTLLSPVEIPLWFKLFEDLPHRLTTSEPVAFRAPLLRKACSASVSSGTLR
jgi:hypothetical protein